MRNETVERLLGHRSIRAYKDKPVEKEIVDNLIEVANHTSTSMGMQSFSIIRVTDKEKRTKIASICNQEYVKDAPEFWVFIADLYRNSSIAAEQDCYLDTRNDADRFFQGFTDACLAAQNVLVAAESYGLGGVFFGSISNDLAGIIEVLNLPEYTFPVLGLGIGYPDQEPLLKPRMDSKFKVFENEYKKEENYLDALKEYDEEMKKYYDMRNPSKYLDEFTKQVVNILTAANDKKSHIITVMRKQGFNLELEYIPESEIRTMFKKTPEKIEKKEFEESKSGLKLDTNLQELFDMYPFVKSYLLSINPKFNKIAAMSMSGRLNEMTMTDLADMGEMPADSLIYMIESRIDEE